MLKPLAYLIESRRSNKVKREEPHNSMPQSNKLFKADHDLNECGEHTHSLTDATSHKSFSDYYDSDHIIVHSDCETDNEKRHMCKQVGCCMDLSFEATEDEAKEIVSESTEKWQGKRN